MSIPMQQRIGWYSAIASARRDGQSVAPGVLRLAGYILERSVDGRVLVPTPTIAAELSVSSKTIARAFDVLVELGFLVLTKRHTQRYAPVYSMARLPTAVHSEHPRLPKHGGSRPRQTPQRCPSDSPRLSARLPSGGDQQGGKQGGEQGEDTVAALGRAGARLKFQGGDISSEWLKAVSDHGLDSIRSALAKLAPKDRWPSRVKAQLEALAELPGLVDRDATPDAIRDALGLPVGGRDG